MDIINKWLGQAMALVRSMSVTAQVTTVALFAVIAISLTFLVRLQTPSADTFLFGGRTLSDREVDRITSAFAAKGLNAWNTPENRIQVPRGQRHVYMAAVAESQALPEHFDGFLEDMVSKSNPFESRQAYETRLMFARQRDLSSIIRAMSGIEVATVRINESPGRGLTREPTYKAVVAARAVGNQRLSSEQVESIRTLVSQASGAATTEVTVADLRGVTHPGDNSGPGLMGNDFAQTKRLYEDEWRSKIERHVLPIIDGALIEVEVTLDTTRQTTTRETTVTGGEPIRESNSTVRSSVRSGTGAEGGAVGARPNGVLGNRPEEVASTGQSFNETTESESVDTREQALSTRETESAQSGFTPTFVSVSIQVPKSHYRQVWLEQNPPVEGEELQEPAAEDLAEIEQEVTSMLQNSVDALLPHIADGRDKWPRIQIASYVDIARPAPAGPSLTSTAAGWLAGNWQTLVMLAAAMFGLLLVRSFVNGGAKAEQILDEELLSNETELPDEEPEQVEVNILRSQREQGPNLQLELAEIVREDPDAAAGVLSQWIGQN